MTYLTLDSSPVAVEDLLIENIGENDCSGLAVRRVGSQCRPSKRRGLSRAGTDDDPDRRSIVLAGRSNTEASQTGCCGPYEDDLSHLNVRGDGVLHFALPLGEYAPSVLCYLDQQLILMDSNKINSDRE